MSILDSDLERHLLRKGLGALARARQGCADCGRTPLAGERVHVFAGEALVCALCRPAHRGEPQRSELVRLAEHGGAVRLRAAA